MSPSLWQRLLGKSSAPKAITAPTEEELAKDKEEVQKAIAEAVSAALNSDDFTKAVAEHLATQLQPSLKAALDISTVETKLLESNAELSKRIDESTSQTDTKLSDLSTLLDTNNTTTAAKITAIEAAVAHITESLVELGYTVKALQESVASPDTSLLTSHGEKLDTISTGLTTLREQGPAPIVAALSSHATQLDTLTAELAVIKQNTESAALKSDLGSLKADLETSSSSGFSGLGTQIGTVLSAIEAQNSTLAEIKAEDTASKVLAGVQTSSDSHAAALAELKSSHDAYAASLADLKASNEDHSAHAKGLLNDIHSAVTAPAPPPEKVDLSPLSDKLDEHSAHLTEIKSAITTPAPAPEKVDLSPLSAKLDEHTAHLTEIKSAVLTPAPAPEKLDISPLSAKLDEHTAHLSEIKSAVTTPAPIPETVDLSPLSAKLDEHTAHLTEIKSAVGTPAPVPEKVDLSTLETSVKEVHSLIEAQSSTLTQIKDTPADTTLELKILSAVEALSTGDAEILGEVKGVKALIVEDKKDQSAEILVEVKEVKALVEKGLAVSVKEVGEENDKGVPVEKNGVKADEAEVVAA